LSNFNFLFSVVFLIISVLFFSYKISTGGGIFYGISKLLFDNNLFFLIFSTISFFICNNYLEIKKIKNLLILVLLIFLEIDNWFYQETYDPLFLICLFFLFDTKIIKDFIQNLSFKKIKFFIFVFNYFLAYKNEIL
jgi:hypothetical protein